MTKLPVVKARACIAALKRAGFALDRQSGSHVMLIRDDPYARVTVPNHPGDLKPGTLRQILRDAGLSIEEFNDLL